MKQIDILDLKSILEHNLGSKVLKLFSTCEVDELQFGVIDIIIITCFTG